MKILCKLKIDLCVDREKIVMGLVNSGYIVKINEEKGDLFSYDTKHYWVVVYEKEEVTPA